MAEEEEEKGGRPGNELHAIWTKAAKEGGGSFGKAREGRRNSTRENRHEGSGFFFPFYVRKSVLSCAREIPRSAVSPGPPPPFYFFQAVFPSPFSPLSSLNGSAAREGKKGPVLRLWGKETNIFEQFVGNHGVKLLCTLLGKKGFPVAFGSLAGFFFYFFAVRGHIKRRVQVCAPSATQECETESEKEKIRALGIKEAHFLWRSLVLRLFAKKSGGRKKNIMGQFASEKKAGMQSRVLRPPRGGLGRA